MLLLRSITWLAVLVMLLPFLAIPDRLLQIVISVLALAIVGLSLKAAQDYSSDKGLGDRTPSSRDNSSTTSTNSSEATPTEASSHSASEDEDTPTDIEDPDADKMVASKQWRKRSSRKLSG